MSLKLSNTIKGTLLFLTCLATAGCGQEDMPTPDDGRPQVVLTFSASPGLITRTQLPGPDNLQHVQTVQLYIFNGTGNDAQCVASEAVDWEDIKAPANGANTASKTHPVQYNQFTAGQPYTFLAIGMDNCSCDTYGLPAAVQVGQTTLSDAKAVLASGKSRNDIAVSELFGGSTVLTPVEKGQITGTIEISLNTNHLTDEEIANIVEYNEKKRIKSNEIRIITQLLAEIKTEFEDQINELNFQGIQNVFQITRYFERELQFGPQRSKIQTLKLIQSINGYASEAVLVRFLYHRELELRNSARYAYMWLSQGNPFRFFDEDIGMKLRKWDMMELHAILEHRKKAGYATPSFIKWVNTSAEEDVKKFFINEIRFYNETESAPILAKQINARSPEIRSEIIRALGTLKYKEIEPKLFEMYNTQPEDVKQNIIAAVLELGTGNAVDFLKNAYEEADNWSIQGCDTVKG